MIKERLKKDRIIKESELDEILNEKLGKFNIDIKSVIDDEKNPKKPEHHPHKPLQHEQKLKPHEKLKLDLDDDYEILIDIFEDEFTADAVIKSLKEGPIEIQIIAKITMNLYKKIDGIYGE